MPRQHAYTLKPGRPTPGSRNLLRPPIASHRGTGILTSFPSTTRFRLALGADSPCADERCAGNLGLTATGLFTLFIATHVSIRTSDASSNPYRSPSQAYRTLSYRARVPFKPLTAQRRLDFAVYYALLAFARKASALWNGLKGTRTPAASVYSLSPVTSSAQDDSTSELLRFL